MAELTVEDYKRGARKAMEANDVEAAKRLIAKARELDGSSQPEATDTVPAGSHRMPDGSVMKDSEMQSEGPDTSLGGALKQGYDQAGKMVGKGIQSGGEYFGAEGVENYGREMAERNEAELAASNYERPEGADGIIKNLKEGEYKNAGNSLLYGATEAAPQVAGGIAASVGAGLAATSAPVLGTVAAIGGTAYGTVNALGQMRDEKEVQGLDPTATASDLGAAVASGLVELTPLKGGGATLKVLRETVQEGVQEGLVIGNTAVQGGEYVSEEVVNRIGDAAITGGALAKGTNTLITTVSKTGEVVLGNRKDLDPETDQAAGDVARLIEDLSKNNKLKLKNIEATSTKGANQALEMARSKIRQEVDAAQAVIRKDLLPDAPPEVLAQFNAAVKQSNNKVSSIVSNENIQFIKDNFGQSQQGQALVNAFRKSNVVTEITNAGLKGGISQFTDQFNPLPSFGRAFNPAGQVSGNLNAGAAVLTGGQSLAFQLPAMVGGRAIDAVTGRRSKVARFVRKNRNNSGLEAPTGTSVQGMAKARRDFEKQRDKQANDKKIADAAQKRQSEADRKDAEQSAIYADDFRRGSDPTINSPRFAAHDRYRGVYKRMGLSPKILAKDIDAEINTTIDQLLSELPKDASPSSKRLAEDLVDYKIAIKSGRNPRNLNSVIGAVATKMMQNSGVTQGPVNTGGPNVNNAASRPLTPRQEGIASNRQLNQELVDAVNASKVAPESKAKILLALSELAKDLGSNPVAKATDIIAKADVSKPLARKYLKPYFDRVVAQQAERKAKAKKKAPKK